MSELRAKALSVVCPVCRAARGVDCDAPRKPGGQHVQRTAIGLRFASRSDVAQHLRAVDALDRARRAGRRGLPIADGDIVGAVSCTCSGECAGIKNLVRICDELRGYGAFGGAR